MVQLIPLLTWRLIRMVRERRRRERHEALLAKRIRVPAAVQAPANVHAALDTLQTLNILHGSQVR